jgi:alpha-tubulin suppressor-like RCC1 family protein
VSVVSLPAARSIASGGSTSCAILASNELWCWGSNVTGEIGNGTTATNIAPQRNSVTAAQKSGLRDMTGCAIVEPTGEIMCWGRGDAGQLGNNAFANSPTPVNVAGVTGARDIAIAIDHVCAVLADGAVACWGDNSFGQLGTLTPGSVSVPTPVVDLSGIDMIHVASTGYATCAATTGGEIYCWGRNVDGELGIGSTALASVPARTIDLCP